MILIKSFPMKIRISIPKKNFPMVTRTRLLMESPPLEIRMCLRMEARMSISMEMMKSPYKEVPYKKRASFPIKRRMR